MIEASTGSVAKPDSPRRALSSKILWGGGFLLALILAGGIGWSIGSASLGNIATLSPTPELKWPQEFSVGKNSETRHEDFFGVQVATSVPENSDPLEHHCLIAVINAVINGSCAPNEFEAVIDIPIKSSSPDELRAQFPDDTVLRLTYDGATVSVHRSDP